MVKLSSLLAPKVNVVEATIRPRLVERKRALEEKEGCFQLSPRVKISAHLSLAPLVLMDQFPNPQEPTALCVSPIAS